MLSTELCQRLREGLVRTGYDTDGVLAVLGRQGHAALTRGEPELAYRATKDAGELGTLMRLFLLGTDEPEQDVHAALSPVSIDAAVHSGLLRRGEQGVRAGLDLRPHGDDQGSWWVLADLDSDQLGHQAPAEHVLGAGQASLSLARATSRRPVASLLDLGTGNGVQALHASRHAERVTATDVSARALALAEATFRLNELDVELARGEWFTPVARRQFEQIVCNPPFVVGPARVDYVYRDSGLAGDDASALLVRQLPGMLTEGGIGQLLASWLHRADQDWADRVSAWLPPGTDAWFVQRDVADPGMYVGTWLRDAGIDPRSVTGRDKAGRWLDWFAANNVEGIGSGFVTLRKTGSNTPTVTCEDLRQAFDDPLGAEAASWLDRVSWLRENQHQLLDVAFLVPENVCLERIEAPGDEEWRPVIQRLHRTDGPGWQHELDELASALLAGCRGFLPLQDLLGLLAVAHDRPTDELTASAIPIVHALVAHGMLVPRAPDGS